MSIINFTLNYDAFTSGDDTTDSGIDVDIIPLIGTVTATPQFVDDRPALATGYSPRPAGFTIRAFSGYIDVDGQLKASVGGPVGMRLWANDPVFGLTRLVYRIDFDLTTPLGEPVKVQGGYFEAPSEDDIVNLAVVLESTGSAAAGTMRSVGYPEDIIGSGTTGRALIRSSNTAAAWTALGTIPDANLPSTVSVNVNDAGYDLIILAGQSNMSGAGIPYSAATDPSDSRIWQYASSGTYANQVIIASEPLAMSTATGIGPGLGFARWYVSGIKPNRRVLLVPVAVGGTPLVTTTPPTWNSTVSGSLYSTMISQTQAALTAAGANARIVACLWVQGETDAINSVTATDYRTALDALVTKLRTDLSSSALPFIVGQMVPDHLPRIFQTRTEINGVQAAIGSRLSKTSFATGPFGQSQADTLHYTAAGQRTLARNMFDAYRRIVNGTADTALPSVPGQPTGVTVSANVVATYTVSWTAVTGAAAYYIDHSATSGGTYTLGATSTGTSATVARLTNGTSEYVRVRAMNAAGAGTASTSVQATIAADTTAPTTPGTPTATAGVGSATLTFSASTDAVGVTGYKVYSSFDAYASPIGTGTASPVTVTGLTPGVGVTFKVSAYDAAGNESGKSSASGSVTPTNYFITDTFTGTAGTALTAHTPEAGGTWGSIGWSWTNNFQLTAGGGVYPTAQACQALNLATPPSADYVTAVDATWASPIPQQWAQLYSRALIATAGGFTYYELRWFPTNVTTAGLIELWKYNNYNAGGTKTLIGTAALVPTSGVTYRMSLSCIGTAIVAKVGSTTISVTDSSITAAGYAGVGCNGWTPDGTGVGLTLDNFTAG